MKKNWKKVHAGIALASAISYVWVVSWLLRDGPGHGRDWMIFPVCMTGFPLLIWAIVACVDGSET